MVQHYRGGRCASRVVAFLLFVATAYSQEPTFPVVTFTTDNGLSHNTITCVHQDSRGFLWVGTIDGLNRYDGYTFKVYRHRSNDPHSLSSSFIHNVYEDRSGTIWVATRDGGVNALDSHTGQFRHYLHIPSDPNTISNNKTSELFEDSDGALWIGTDNGLCRLDTSRRTVTRFFHSPSNASSLSSNLIGGIAEDAQGMLWVSTPTGLNRMDRRTGRCVRYLYEPNASVANVEALGRLRIGKDGNIWIGTQGVGILRFDPATVRLTRYLSAKNELGGAIAAPSLFDQAGQLWIGSQRGIHVLNLETGSVQRIAHDPSGQSGLSHENTSNLFMDRHGDVWVGTWGGGLNKTERSKRKFGLVQFKRTDGTDRSAFVLSVLVDKGGTLWIGTAQGVFAPQKGENVLRSVASLNGDVVWSLLEGSDGSVWAGTNRGIIAINGSKTVLVHSSQPGNPYSLPGATVRAMYRDRRGLIWAGTERGGVAAYSESERRWIRYPYGVQDGSGTTDSLVWAICEDNRGHLWFGTYNGGLNRLDPTTGRFSYFRHTPTDSTSLGANDVRSIHVAKDGAIWIGTYGGGVNLLDPASGSFRRFTERDGLANNFVYGILEAENGDLWISTNRGVSRFHPKTRTFRSYSSRDGLQSDEFNTGAYHVAANGEMFLGGVNGLNRFFPWEVKNNPHVPPIVMTSFSVFDREAMVGREVQEIDTIALRYDENFFSFEFAALDLVDPVRNQYAYKLVGFDKDWVYSGSRRYVSYTNLDPGEYVLRVKGSNNDGVWNEEGKTIHITIVPPFWQRWWFRGILVLGLLVAFAIVVRYLSTRSLKAQLHELEKARALQAERERISRDLHDHAGAQLASIIAGLEVVERQHDLTSEKAREMVNSLRDDARSGMMRLRETIWAIKTHSMSIEDFAEAIQSYADRLLKYNETLQVCVENRIQCNLSLSPNHVLNLYRIVQESLTNVLKHSNATTVMITFELINGKLKMCIEDNGEGNGGNADALSGRGVTNMRDRAGELGGVFGFHQLDGKGTAVEITVPV